MTKIYIDTNIFLDFYQSATDRLSVFEEIEKHSQNIVLTEQTITEFRRNKNARLNELAKNINKSASFNIHTTALVQSLPEFKAWVQVRDEGKKLAKKVSSQLLAWSKEESSDPIHVAFEGLVSKSETFRTTIESIEKAKARKLLGNPPTSPDKHTIGDELIWETILSHSQSNLIIVSRDKTFLENISLLRREYAAFTKHDLIDITPKLSDAFNALGTPAKTVENAEREIGERKAEVRYPFPLTLATKCPKCGGELEETGFEGSDGDSMWWVFCTQCGSDFFPDQFSQ